MALRQLGAAGRHGFRFPLVRRHRIRSGHAGKACGSRRERTRQARPAEAYLAPAQPSPRRPPNSPKQRFSCQLPTILLPRSVTTLSAGQKAHDAQRCRQARNGIETFIARGERSLCAGDRGSYPYPEGADGHHGCPVRTLQLSGDYGRGRCALPGPGRRSVGARGRARVIGAV